MSGAPFRHSEGRAGSWQVADDFHVVLDSIPTETAAKNVAHEMNCAWQRGYAAAQENIRKAIGARGR